MSRRTLAVTALVITVLIWGTTFVATKVALREVQPLTLTLVRFLLASVLLVPLAVAEQRRRRGPLAWRGLAVAGFLGGFLYFALQNLGLAFTSASKASLILGSVPAVTALLSILVLKERVTLGQGAGIAASVLGVGIIVVGASGDGIGEGALLGDLLVAGSALAWALYTVQVKGLDNAASPAALAAASSGFGALFLLPFVGFEVAAYPPTMPSMAGWLAIAYLGFVASAVTFLFWNFGLQEVDASEAGAYTNLVPVVAVASAVPLLGESLAPAHLIGGLLVLAGVWAAGGGLRRRQAADSSARA